MSARYVRHDLDQSEITSRGSAVDVTDSGTASLGKGLATVVSLAGTIVGLVAALGFPAAIVQFARLEVPIQFLTYDRALRAGVLPAITLVLLVTLVWGLGQLLSRLRQFPQVWTRLTAGSWSKVPETKAALKAVRIIFGVMVIGPFALGVAGVFLAASLVMIAGMLVWLAFPFVWAARVFGLPVVIGTLIILGVLWLSFNRHMLRRIRQRILNPRPMTDTQTDLQAGSSDRTTLELPFIGLLGGLTFGAWVWAALLSVRWSMRSWLGIEVGAPVTDRWLLLAAALFGLIVYSVYFAGFSAPAFASDSRVKRGLAWAELILVGTLLYGAFAWAYSDKMYHTVPHAIGGGKPEPVVLEYNPGQSGTDLGRLLPAAKCSRSGTHWSCEAASWSRPEPKTG